jgi:hypothetical protein
MSQVIKKLEKLGLHPNYIIKLDMTGVIDSDAVVSAIYDSKLLKVIDESDGVYGFEVVASGLTFLYHRENEKWVLDYIDLPNNVKLDPDELNNIPIEPEDEKKN